MLARVVARAHPRAGGEQAVKWLCLVCAVGLGMSIQRLDAGSPPSLWIGAVCQFIGTARLCAYLGRTKEPRG